MSSTSRSKKDEYEDIEDLDAIEAEAEILPEETIRCSGVSEEEESSRAITKAEEAEGYIELRGKDYLEEKERLLATHHKKKGSLIAEFSRGNLSAEDGVELLIRELLREAEELKGSQLLFATRGNARDEATIIVKRIEALEKIAKTVHRKQKMISEEVVNLDSPYIRILVTYMINKINETFIELGYESEVMQIFFEKFQSLTDNWKKEVKRDMVAFKDRKMMGDDDEDEEKK